MVYKNKNTYVGGWVDDKRHGHGVYTWAGTGEKYEGGWERGKKCGKGIRMYPIGEV